jgi:TPR repeat protein
MNNLAFYYEHGEKNYELAKKYYLMAIDKGNTSAIFNLIVYYINVEKNYDLAKKYYLMMDVNVQPKKQIEFVINNLLYEIFDIKFAIDAYSFVNQQNINKFNQEIQKVFL